MKRRPSWGNAWAPAGRLIAADVLVRVRRPLRLVVLLLLALYVAVLVVGSPLVRGPVSDLQLGDFGSFYASGLAASQGLDPYAAYPLTLGFERGGSAVAVNLNAPLALPFFELIAISLEPHVARQVWFIISTLAYVVTLGLLWRAFPQWRSPLNLAWAFAIAGFWETISLGQIYAVLALVSAVAWLLSARRPTLAGLLIGFLVAFKPNFAVWPVLLWLGGQRRLALTAGGTTVVFGVLPVLRYGPGVYLRWLDVVRADAINGQVANASVGGLLVRMGAPQGIALAGIALALALLAVYVWRAKPSARRTSSLAVVGLLLCSPLAWVGYTLFLLPLFASQPVTLALVIAEALLLIPRPPLQAISDDAAAIRFTLGASYTLAWLVLFGLLLARRDTRTANADQLLHDRPVGEPHLDAPRPRVVVDR